MILVEGQHHADQKIISGDKILLIYKLYNCIRETPEQVILS
jgi:hypothetical protein